MSTHQRGRPAIRPMLALGLALWGGTADAEPKSPQDAAVQQTLRKAQGMLRQLAQEKSALETEKATLQAQVQEQAKKLEDAVRQLGQFQTEAARYKASAESLQSANGALETQVNQGREQAQALRRKQQEIIGKARQLQADNQLLVQAVKEREQWIGQCGERNQGLIKAEQELLEKYRDKSVWDELAEIEPFTGIGQVRTENAVQDYRFKLEDLKATPFQAEAQAGGSPPGAVPATADPEAEDDEP
jgi:chromosome segregation ATPase